MIVMVKTQKCDSSHVSTAFSRKKCIKGRKHLDRLKLANVVITEMLQHVTSGISK